MLKVTPLNCYILHIGMGPVKANFGYFIFDGYLMRRCRKMGHISKARLLISQPHNIIDSNEISKCHN